MAHSASVAAPPAKPERRAQKGVATRRWRPIVALWPIYLMVLPAVLWRAAFTVVPLMQTFWLSLTNTSLVNAGAFVGLKNFEVLVSDPALRSSLQFTLVYTGGATLLEVGLGLLFALVLNQRITGISLANVALLLPWAVAPLLVAVIFKVLFIEDGGALNALLMRFVPGMGPVPWLSDPSVAKVSVILTSVWKNVSWVTLIYLAALKALPQEVFEAAAVDGARGWSLFRWITLPMLQATTLLVILLRSIGEIQTFEQIFALTRGGPGSATQVLALYGYQRFFQEFRYGYGSAVNVVLFLLTALVGGFFAWRLYRANQL